MDFLVTFSTKSIWPNGGELVWSFLSFAGVYLLLEKLYGGGELVLSFLSFAGVYFLKGRFLSLAVLNVEIRTTIFSKHWISSISP